MNELLITTEIMKQLENGYLTDSELGNLSEKIAEILLDTIGVEYQRLNKKGMQSYLGDYIAINKHNEPRYIEVKTSHSFKKIDKLAMDYRYFEKGTCANKPYNQCNTDNNLGWLYNNINAHVLICVNPYSKMLYYIRDYQKVKNNIIDLIEEYNDKVDYNTWYYRNHNNYIHKYLEGSVNKRDYLKDSLIVNLELSKKAIKHFEGRLNIFKLVSETDINTKAA